MVYSISSIHEDYIGIKEKQVLKNPTVDESFKMDARIYMLPKHDKEFLKKELKNFGWDVEFVEKIKKIKAFKLLGKNGTGKLSFYLENAKKYKNPLVVVVNDDLANAIKANYSFRNCNYDEFEKIFLKNYLCEFDAIFFDGIDTDLSFYREYLDVETVNFPKIIDTFKEFNEFLRDSDSDFKWDGDNLIKLRLIDSFEISEIKIDIPSIEKYSNVDLKILK